MSRRSHRSQHSPSQYISNDDLFNYLNHLLLPKPEVVTIPEVRGHRSQFSVLSNFSIGDLFKDVRDGSKSAKFPEKFLKVLEQKLQNVAMGKDSAYSDQLVRRTMAVFYGQFQATIVLKKEPTLAEDGWKLEVNNQIAVFVKMLSDCLRTVHNVSPELLSRLDTYTAKLAPATQSSASDSGYALSSPGSSISDMVLVRVREIDAMRGTCTEKAALTDLKTCLKNLSAGAPFPGRREDFDTDEAWQNWRTLETTHLQQLMVVMMQANPGLAKSSPADNVPTLLPYHPSTCLAKRISFSVPQSNGDAEAYAATLQNVLSTVNEDDLYHPTSTLSHHPSQSTQILQTPPRALLDIPMECVPEALNHISTSLGEMELGLWASRMCAEYLFSVCGGLYNTFIGHIYHAMDAIPALKPSDIEPHVEVLERLRGSGLLERLGDTEQTRIDELRVQIRQAALRWYGAKLEELQAAPGVNRALPLLLMTDELEKTAQTLDKRQLDLVAIVVEVQVPQLLRDINASQQRLIESPDVPIQDIFTLYRRSKTLLAMYTAFCPDAHVDEFDLNAFFEPYVRSWLGSTDNRRGNAEGAECHSSSVVDLFDSLKSSIDFLVGLEWENEFQMPSVANAVEQYCRTVEGMFMVEMFPRPNTNPLQRHQRQQSSGAMWLERARQLAALQDKKASAEPFNFQPESCVKLNNVEAARRLLDNMYTQMEADKIAEIGRSMNMEEPQRCLFSVKIVAAEGLITTGSQPDKRLWVTIAIHDRALANHYDTVGQAHLALDARSFGDKMHDVWLDLDAGGRILVRVSMEPEKDDIQFYFGRAFRSLKRSESDMLHMSPFIHQCLSRNVLRTLLKTGSSGLGYNKAISNVTALWSSLGNSSNDVQIPLPNAEKPRTKPEELTDVEIEQAIMPLFDYFEANLRTFNTYLSETAKEMVMTRLLVPPLSDVLRRDEALSDKEFLRDYIHAKGEGPNQKYRDVLSIRLYYDWHTDALMEECVRMMQQTLRSAPTSKKRRNLGSIKQRKREKKEEKEVPETSDFIAQQLELLSTIQAEQDQRAKELEQRKLNRPSDNPPWMPTDQHLDNNMNNSLS
ncbi:hypothetical protein R3P38DRAFT_3316586 [Favolaschia claudopus]|uniref:MHD2 domain-containing protein n=1 Tax=Favolaschia claudopus TaxID=2862362 RepID=A0AAW0BF99_9AGAR